MAKPTTINLTKGEQKKIVASLKETSDAKKIAKNLNLPRRDVMAFLELEGYKEYSEGSY